MAKILIVEDNALNIKLFCDLLAAHGHQPEAVTDSRNALDAARAFEPDLVITDIQLPHVSGLDLIRLIRKDDELADGADHGGDGLFGARRRGADPRGGRAGLCVEADFGGEVRRRRSTSCWQATATSDASASTNRKSTSRRASANESDDRPGARRDRRRRGVSG